MAVFDPNVSKIKMVILTKTNEKNVVWWSPKNQNKRSSQSVVQSMLKRLEKNKLFKITNVVQFYENTVLIAQYKL